MRGISIRAAAAALPMLLLVACSDAGVTTAPGGPRPVPEPPLSAADQEVLLGTHEVRLIGDGTEIEFIGTITLGAFHDLDDMLESHPGVRVIQLTSVGGLVPVAFDMAGKIYIHKLTTYVPKLCGSGCAILFLAGRERYAAPDAELGFSQSFSAVGDAKANQLYNGAMKFWMLHNGVTRSFADRAMATRPTTLWVPTTAELLAGHVLTGSAADQHFASPSFRPDWPDVADRALLNHALYQAVRKTEPDTYAEMRDAAVRRLRSGVYGTGRYDDRARPLGLAIERALPKASDAALLDYAGAVLAVLEESGGDGPCGILGPGGTSQPRAVPRLTRAESRVAIAATAVIETAGANPQPLPSEERFQQAVGRLLAAHPELLVRLSPPLSGEVAMSCAGAAAYLRLLLAADPPDRAVLLRYGLARPALRA